MGSPLQKITHETEKHAMYQIRLICIVSQSLLYIPFGRMSIFYEKANYHRNLIQSPQVKGRPGAAHPAPVC